MAGTQDLMGLMGQLQTWSLELSVEVGELVTRLQQEAVVRQSGSVTAEAVMKNDAAE